NNIGIEKAKGKYILLLNPDTILEEKTLSTMFDYMELHTEVGIAGCKLLNSDGTFQVACRRGFPTPWASFCKLFGLQKVFPKSKLFARYNQTFRNIDETYYIDAIMGAFMFCRKQALNDVKGFDPDYFMYGEDLDICYRASKAGWKIAYIHETSIIHFKGESTKRSSINEVRHFYEAMDIFARKHYSKSMFFSLFLKTGIFIRSLLAYILKFRRESIFLIFDLLVINFSMILGTKIRFHGFFRLPDYAYPTVFIALSCVLIISMIAAGEYFEKKPSVKRSFFGLLISFFILSSLTYFFNNYAFSRGILLMTIGFTIVLSSLFRFLINLYDKMSGKDSSRRIAFLGINEKTFSIIKSLENSESLKAQVVGAIYTEELPDNEISHSIEILGNIDFLPKIINNNNINEVIITDSSFTGSDLITLIRKKWNPFVRFHVANEYEDLVVSRILSDITGKEPSLPEYNINFIRYRILKRITDISISIIILLLAFPFVYLIFRKNSDLLRIWLFILKGRLSLVGMYPDTEETIGEGYYRKLLKSAQNTGRGTKIGKYGLLGIARISAPNKLSKQAISNLNDYYLKNYSISLDIEIFLKFIFRKKSAN
ncbi:MAG: hypothetical protein QG635_2365, partial [Bacteroidota bacterium]|nr:hypothetical protein [Bacteroidota bacterium]